MPFDPVTFAQGAKEIDSLLAIVKTIVDTAKKVIRFKKECLELAEDSALLLAILQSNQSTLQNLEISKKLHTTLTDCLSFAVQCQQWNIRAVLLDVLLQNRYSRLKKDLSKWISDFKLEVGVETLVYSTEISSLVSEIHQNMTDFRREIRDNHNEVLEEIAGLHKELRNIRQASDHKRPGPPDIHDRVDHFTVHDNRLVLESESSMGLLHGTLNGARITCYELEDAKLGGWPKLAYLYYLISATVPIQVQRFYGILDKSSRKYAVMQDLRLDPSLAETLQLRRLPSLSARLRLAYEIASTMALLHQGRVLLKSLSDDTVKLKASNGGLAPIITKLESARQFLEATAAVPHDVRYEAPEYQTQYIHTAATDIWSGEFPFNATEAVGKERRLSIRKQLSEGMLPWGSEKPSDIEWAEVVPIITNCWRRTPTLRPPPAFVAEQILAIYTRFSALPASEQESAPLDKESVEIIISRCSEIVQKARNGETGMEKLTDAEFRVLLQRNQQAFDPVTSFLLGAAIWWQVSKFNDWNDDLSEAYGMHPQTILALRALRFLTAAADAGHDEAGKEASKAYSHLASFYSEMSKSSEGMDGI